MDLQKAIEAMAKSGLTQMAIAKLVGSSQPTINRAAHGGDIKFSTGVAILGLYHRLQGEPAPTLTHKVPAHPAPEETNESAVNSSSAASRPA